jgi:hypothetical protein
MVFDTKVSNKNLIHNFKYKKIQNLSYQYKYKNVLRKNKINFFI